MGAEWNRFTLMLGRFQWATHQLFSSTPVASEIVVIVLFKGHIAQDNDRL
jgi:hypothetical protein